MPIINSFPLGTDEGLSKIPNQELDNKPLFYINELKRIVPKQPNFIITRDDWRALTGNHVRNDGKTPKLYEVYALVFCYGLKATDYHPSYFFFRVRRILKAVGSNDGTLFLDTENIAFVDVEIALENKTKLKKKRLSCLKFINANDGEFNEVNGRINDFKSSLRDLPSINSQNIPLGTLPNNYDSATPIPVQEGNIFGKNRIWDELLDGKYSDANRKREGKALVDHVVVNFAYNKKTKSMFFVFNINDDYGTTGIKCPVPPVCGDE